MRDSVEPFKKALHKSEISEPLINVYSNVDGRRYTSADHIKRQLPKQVSILITRRTDAVKYSFVSISDN